MPIRLRKRLGDLLVEEGIITEDQLQAGLIQQQATGFKLGDCLMQMGCLSETQMLSFLSHQLNLPLVNLNRLSIDVNAVSLLPEVQARRLRALVIGCHQKQVRVVMSDPADLVAQETLYQLLHGYEIDLLICAENQLLIAFDRYYRRTQAIASFAQQLSSEHQAHSETHFGVMLDDNDDVTIAKLIHSLFEDAVQMGASDIHIEPDEHVLRIRQRIDGQLQETILKETTIASALVLRLKLMSGLDIAEKRLPQDGRFPMQIRDQSLDVRISTLPVQYGESVVMRLLNQSTGILDLDQVGMPESMLQRFRHQLRRPHGMILVTGPTGSGKTTTLYAALNELNVPGRKLLTIEDPVEYRLPRVNQVQVNTKIGLDFSTALRTFLRQDPDVILVGEMRDQETAEIGLRSALTGHLVLSTLHTNQAIDSALRLMDMGAPGYLVASSVKAIIAQRLVRCVCDECGQPERLTDDMMSWLVRRFPEHQSHSFVSGTGCQHCHFTGYKGRQGVFEFLELDRDMMAALRNNDSVLFTELALKSSTFISLSSSALALALDGKTSLSEVMMLCESNE